MDRASLVLTAFDSTLERTIEDYSVVVQDGVEK